MARVHPEDRDHIGSTIGQAMERGTRLDFEFRILLSDASVKAIFINVFGGILRCDTLATGVVTAARELNVKVPIVVRMEGTNQELGKKILLDSGLNFTVADGMKDGAEKVVALASQASSEKTAKADPSKA